MSRISPFPVPVLVVSLLASAFVASRAVAQPATQPASPSAAPAASQPAGGAASSRATKPNIIILLVDDLGSHDVSWRGSEIKTPNIDALANAGVKLEAFYVQPVCSPTRAALLTGRYPYRYGQQNVVRPWAKKGLDLDEKLLSTSMKEAGYETAIVGKWHLGHVSPEYLPTHRGFDHQYGHYNGALDYDTHFRDGGFDWHRDDKVNHDEGYSTQLIGHEAARLIAERDKAKPLFLYVPFNGVHAPYMAPARYVTPYAQFKGNRKIYAGMTTAVDDAVGEIMGAVRTAEIGKNTLIFFSSDNGGPAPGRITSNGEFRAGKGTIYEGGVRTCAFVNWPGVLQPGKLVNTPMHMVDLYPTLIAAGGGKVNQSLPLDGRDMMPALTGEVPSLHDVIPLNMMPNGGAIRVGDWKLVYKGGGHLEEDDGPNASPAPDKEPAKYALYNLIADPSEKKDVSAENPQVLRDLIAKYEVVAKDVKEPIFNKKPKDYQVPKVWGE